MDNSSKTLDNGLTSLLDSKLIVTTKLDQYNIKLVDCGDYVQVYKYQNTKTRTNKDAKSEDLELEKIKLDVDLKNKKDNEVEKPKEIKEKNIIRSKLECQRIAKANMNEWKTFITLTFAENETDIKQANKKFRYFVDRFNG